MLKSAMYQLFAARHLTRPARTADTDTVRLSLPPSLSANLGCDAVGVPSQHGLQLLTHLPRIGCVFADTDRWWWIVPAGSDLDLDWPAQTSYATGAYVPAAQHRLIHHPDTRTPYTPPIPLFLMVCQLTGVQPSWAPSGGTPVVSTP
ncbi:hypothetical protein AB0L71_13020 [Streptomyces sp. NPDC052052]|uniref:hypothetical protein n=1 Tax=Streptomyces sp. NPDC052052 TaxID=3154756 RepID=UPI00341334C9